MTDTNHMGPFEKELTTNLNLYQPTHKPKKLPWAHDVINKIRYAGISKTPSLLYTWYHEERDKRAQGLENELDINEIKVAIKGTLNKWSKAVKDSPELFKPLQLKDRKLDWEAVKQLKKSST